ncbi:MAG: hypothetical protein LC799_03375 [Actinobacteria bacterium]|nr:hypothetical protein [Actinomycetota bacterium]
MSEIDAGRLVLHLIDLETARALLEGSTPADLVWARTIPHSSLSKSWTSWPVRGAKVYATSARSS